MSNPWSRKTKPKKLTLKGLAKDNGKAPVKPTLASLAKGEPKPKVTLGAALGVKQPDPERPYQAPKPRHKDDFRVGGVLFSGAEVTGEDSKGYRDGMFRPVGTVDITNGDQTYTFHNRYGSWMHDMWTGSQMAEPARVGAMLNISMSQLEIARALSKRFELALKAKKIPNTHQQRIALEEKAKLARKRTAKPTTKETTDMTTKPKLSLKGLKK